MHSMVDYKPQPFKAWGQADYPGSGVLWQVLCGYVRLVVLPDLMVRQGSPWAAW